MYDITVILNFPQEVKSHCKYNLLKEELNILQKLEVIKLFESILFSSVSGPICSVQL